ncbi:MAG: hypothetical protein R2698_04465 [Microthrixaceae bacterium]
MTLTPTPRLALYSAEDEVVAEVGPRLGTFRAVEHFLERTLLDDGVAQRYPHVPLDVSLIRRGRAATCSFAHAPTRTIAIRSGSFDALTVLHELAHLIVGPDRGHDERFVAVELDLVRLRCGFEAFALLRRALDRHGVRYQDVP